MKATAFALPVVFCLLFNTVTFSQSLPVGAPLLEDAWRTLQLKGERDINTSFCVRPVFATSQCGYDSLYNPTRFFSDTKQSGFVSFLKGKGSLRLLPITFSQEYNADHPYGWNDGSMIPARGYQAHVSAGVYAQAGPLSLQLRPEYVYAENKNFTTFGLWTDLAEANIYYTTVLNKIDAPERFGDLAYSRPFLGQSSLRLNFLRKLSIGASTENLWWGPGVRNSLLMTNNAPGFPHLTFNTTAPVKSPVGSFEWQVVSGRLKGSGILPDTNFTYFGKKPYINKGSGDRYFNGMVLTWQPKWMKGFYLGYTRAFYLYTSDLQPTFDGYLPVFAKFLKKNLAGEDNKKRDEMTSLFFRLAMPKAKAEVYGEWGRNDNAADLRDLLLEPDHTRGYVIGFKKMFEQKRSTDLELWGEFSNLQHTSTMLLRAQESWYSHYQVLHGYTNLGQIIGGGVGPGGSSQTVGLSWVNGVKKTGFFFERWAHNNDFFYAYAQREWWTYHWTDVSINFNKSWTYQHFIFTAEAAWVYSFNYDWTYHQDRNNLHAILSASYLF